MGQQELLNSINSLEKVEDKASFNNFDTSAIQWQAI